ncbi:MAG TPA: cytochrome P450 [Acidimicrobiia bacterium]|jgi:cytochrome P450
MDPVDRTAGVAALSKNPYPALAELRHRGSVREGEIMSLLGTDLPMTSGLNAVTGPAFSVFGYDEVREVLRDGATFSSSAYGDAIGQVLGRTILEMDEPEHRRYRRLIAAAFAPAAVERWRDDVAVPVLVEMLDDLRRSGAADLVEVLTFPYPVRVIGRLLGLPDEDREQFHEWATTIVDPAAFEDPALATQREHAMAALTDFLRRIIGERRRAPRDDITTLLVTAEVDGERLEDEEIVSFLRLLLPAGAETTFRSSGNLLFALLADPQQQAIVRADTHRTVNAIEEALRWEPPIMSIGRVTTRDVRLGPCELPTGAAVHVSLAAANHDDSVFADPETYDLERASRPHVSFAGGPHTCVGIHLARMEMTAMLGEIFDALPGLRYAEPGGDGSHVDGLGFRAPTALGVVWDQ